MIVIINMLTSLRYIRSGTVAGYTLQFSDLLDELPKDSIAEILSSIIV